MPVRNNILLQKLAQPRRVTLQNGRKILARCEHVNRASLYPTNVRINRSKKTKKTKKKTARGKWVYRLTKHNKRNRPWKKSSKY